jgi:hypothetical protein
LPASTAIKHHALNTLYKTPSGEVGQPWRYERSVVDPAHERRLLVQIIIAKITCAEDVVDEIMRSVPVYQVDDEDEAAKDFNCVAWARAALEELRRRGAVKGAKDWPQIQMLAMEYVQQKRDEGRWSGNAQEDVPTLSLLTDEEVVE